MWKEIDTVLYYVDPKFKFNTNVAIFSFIKTLIKDSPNLEYMYENVKEKLYEIDQKGASIIIFQSFDNDNVDFIKKKFDTMLNDINIPFVAFFFYQI